MFRGNAIKEDRAGIVDDTRESDPVGSLRLEESVAADGGVKGGARLTAVVGAAGVVLAGCFAAGWWFGADSRGKPSPPTAVGQLQTCGAFSVTDVLLHESMRPDEAPDAKPPRIYDLIGLASALNSARSEGLSPALDSAVTAYIYALTNLGAVINHHEPVDDIESMYIVVNTSAQTVTSLCEAAGAAPAPRPAQRGSRGTSTSNTESLPRPVESGRGSGDSPGPSASVR
jgi:hypothetical protein